MDTEPSQKGESLQSLAYQDLLFSLKEPAKSPFTINDLKTELYRRVKNRLFQHCVRLCTKNRMDNSTAKELTQKAVLKGFDNIQSFTFDGLWPEEKFGNKIAAWINKIAYNLFIDLLKERSKFVGIDDGYNDIEDVCFRPDDYEFDKEDMLQIKLQDAVDSLNDREKFIINICIKHDCLDNNNHLPDEAIEDICSSLNVSKGNIRIIKLRALQKMRTILKKN